MLKALRQRPETVFVLVLLWKAALLIFTAQPVPGNDSFFYDGAVVNLLSGGRYCNPSIANALPISGAEVFSGYPPLYQLALLGWMSVAGTSVISSVWLHFLMFSGCAVLVLAVLCELGSPVWAAHFSGLFLIGITFHDRPDSLAHVLGMAAVYSTARVLRSHSPSTSSPANLGSDSKDGEDFCCSVDRASGRNRQGYGRRGTNLWHWLSALCVVLCLCTSLQIGGIYFLMIALAFVLPPHLPNLNPRRAEDSPAARLRTPWLPLAVMTVVPLALVLAVRFGWPHLWAGFLEHAQQTPTVTSWRWPNFLEVLKIIRSVPGVLVVLALLPLAVWPVVSRRRENRRTSGTHENSETGPQITFSAGPFVLLLATSGAVLIVLLAALFFLAANLVLIAAYLQPLLAGVFLTTWAKRDRSDARLASLKVGLGLAVLIVSVRAVGLTTLGVACSADVSEREARKRIAAELAAAPEHSTVGLSSAYLYDAWPMRDRLTLLHADWLGPAAKHQLTAEFDALCAVRPTRLILTQFDYHRRYVRVLGHFAAAPDRVNVRVEDLARVRPPDASPRWQRVVQHVSWAPVIVTLEWSQ